MKNLSQKYRNKCYWGVYIKDINFVNNGKSIEVNYPNLQTSILKSQQYKEKVVECLKSVLLFSKEFVQCYNVLVKQLTNVISKLDVLQTRIYNAEKYNYCLPEILDIQEGISYINGKDMRHCLIELQQNEIYVPNDICLGMKDTQGMLLYGTNAVGKTSFIRAMGILYY